MKQLFLLLTCIVNTGLCSFSQNTSPLPATIGFERMVIQQTNGEDGVATNTYYFTLNGDYAIAKHKEPGDDEMKMVLYTKEGQMCMINEKEKTILIMNMPRIVGEGAAMGKEVAEKIKKQPLQKDAPLKMTVTKTGKTKTICGHTSYEYEIKNEGGTSNWWYAQVDFNPVKIYTMGAGSSTISGKKAEELKNNPAAIPVLNKNYLWAEADVAGKKGLETKSISASTFSFSTAGYTIKDMSKKGLKDVIKSGN